MTIPAMPDPLDLFQVWFDEAKACEAIDPPTAMTLATVDETGQPWPRVVLLKQVDRDGFAFYTNLGSHKSRQLEGNPKAGLCFYWMPLDKQVRILGPVEAVSDEEADEYFATRPRESQIGAWASIQSHALSSREELVARVAKFEKKYEGQDVPRPSFWSGFRVVPNAIEFWQSQPHRLHDRLLYTLQDDGAWRSQLLYP